jgi:20S proteasome subunit alpha 5
MIIGWVANDRYHAEPSGTFYRYDAKAIGSGSEGAQAELQQEYFKVFIHIDKV